MTQEKKNTSRDHVMMNNVCSARNEDVHLTTVELKNIGFGVLVFGFLLDLKRAGLTGLHMEKKKSR